MKTNSRFGLFAVGAAGALFVGMLISMELGRQIGLREFAERGAASRTAVGIIDGAVFGLLSLLLGFSFSGAAGRFERRRTLVASEVNSIGTAWQRIDTLPAPQTNLRAAFQKYVDELIASYASSPARSDLLRAPERLARAEAEIWSQTLAACLDPSGEKARMLLIPSVNEMFGAVEQERLARRIHPPPGVFVMLVVSALTASVFGGYGMATADSRNWLHMIGVAAAISITLYVVIDLEFPRLGFLRMVDMDRALSELRATMR